MSLLHRLRSAPTYYEATVNRPAPCPPLQGAQRTQVAVVGGGLAGVSAALELAARGFQVTLLEAQRIGSVASGRNGGQVLAGLACDMATIEQQLGREGATRVWHLTTQAVQLVRERLHQHRIDADLQEGTLCVSCTAKGVASLERDFHALGHRHGGQHLQWLDRPAVRQHIGSDRYHGGWRDPEGLHLHPLKYLLGLSRAAQALGVTVHERTRVRRVEHGPRPVLHTEAGTLTCDTLVLAGGAPLGEDVPPFNRLTMPCDSWILATQALPPALAHSLIPGLEAVADDSHDIDYFRLTPEGRLLFGSGCDFFARSPEQAREGLRRRMVRVFPQLADVQVAHFWGGVMEIPMNRAPVMGQPTPQVLHLQGFGGHGVAFAGMAGRLAAQHLAGDGDDFALMARLRHRPFPFGRWLQQPMMMAGICAHRWAERLL